MASRAAEAGEQARRRRERAQKASDPIRRRRNLLIGFMVGSLLVGGLFFAFSNAPAARECPDHWHATFAVFVDGTQVPFDHSAFRQNTGGYHMHANDAVLHYHPPSERCIPLSDMMRHVGITIDGTTLKLASEHGPLAGTYAEGDGKVLSLHHKAYQGAWRQVTWDEVRRMQLGDGDKWLVSYGAADDATIAAQQQRVPDLPPEYTPR